MVFCNSMDTFLVMETLKPYLMQKYFEIVGLTGCRNFRQIDKGLWRVVASWNEHL